MIITIRRLGEHRGAPRLYLDSVALTAAGFVPGLAYRIKCDHDAVRVTVALCDAGDRRVSKKRRAGVEVPVIDINSHDHLGVLAAWGVVRVIVTEGVIHILALASHRAAAERAARLAGKLEEGLPLLCGSIAFGIGITSSVLHEGLGAGGVAAELALANDISDEFAQVAMVNNALVTSKTTVLNVPLQEAIADVWSCSRLPPLEILELGVPCSGASRAGAAKRKLAKPEDHPHVGHLVAAIIQWIAAFQPAIVVAECAPGYETSASAAILRAWLRDAGYGVEEAVLDARDFGSLEARVRWFMVAHPPAMEFTWSDLASPTVKRERLSDVLDEVSPDDERYRRVDYLKAKPVRDRMKGNGFGMQLIDVDATQVPTLRRGYHKGGSTDPRLRHPTDPSRSRLLTGAEHARIKGIDPALLAGLSETKVHMVCGQAVDTRPVHAIGQRLAESMRRAQDALVDPHRRVVASAAKPHQIVG